MEITEEQIQALMGESPFTYRRSSYGNGYEVVELTNEDWKDVIPLDDEIFVRGRYSTHEEARDASERMHIKWVFGYRY